MEAVEEKRLRKFGRRTRRHFAASPLSLELARESGRFDINDVLATLKLKLVTASSARFRQEERRKEMTPDEVKRQWNIIKERERAKKRSAKK